MLLIYIRKTIQIIPYLKLKFLLALVAYSYFNSVSAQNKNCSFDWNTYYFASSIGTDKNSQKQAITFLFKTIFDDFKSKFNQSTFNRILTRCNVVRTCQTGNNQTTAYVLRSSCRSCFTCQPNINVSLTNIPDNNIRSNIQNNASDFFKELYCGYEQNTGLKSNRFISNGNVRSLLEKLWVLSPIRCADFTFSKKAYATNYGYRVENIPVILENSQVANDEIAVSFDKTGTIIDFSFMTTTRPISDKLSQNVVSNVNIFLGKLRTAYIIKDSILVMKLLLGDNPSILTPSQNNYLTLLKKYFNEKNFVNYLFDKIELCPLINDPSILGVSIYHKSYRIGQYEDLGFLTLFLEMKNQGSELIINSFKISMNKLDPCFP